MTASVRERPQSQRLVTENEIDKALDFLRDSAAAIGEAKRRTRMAEHMVKHIEALMSKASEERSAEARKADARTTDRWLQAIQEDAVAAGEYEKLRSLREAAALKIAAWQSESANHRAMKI